MAINWGQKIRKRRLETGLKVFELAQKIGVNPTYLTQIEKYNRAPSAKVAIRLAKALGEDPKEYVIWSVKARIEPEARPYLSL